MRLCVVTLICLSKIGVVSSGYAPSHDPIDFPSEEEGFKAFGEFLYWKTTTDPLPYAITFVNLTLPAEVGGSTIANNTTFETVDFAYSPGFRVGALYEGARDFWDIGVTWTQFQQTATNSVWVNAPEELGTLWGPTLSPSDRASAVQTQHFTNIDFELGRLWPISQYFFLRGALAAELAWLSEQLTINYLGTVNTNDFRTNSCGAC